MLIIKYRGFKKLNYQHLNVFRLGSTFIILLIFFLLINKTKYPKVRSLCKGTSFTDPQIQHVSLIYLPLAPKCNRCVAKQKELFAYLYLAQVWRLAPAKLTDSSIYYYSYLFTSNKTLNFFGSPNLHPTKV